MSETGKYSQVGVGPCRYQFSLQWVVFCWYTQKGRQIPPSWAQKQGTPEGEWTHSAEVESSLHLRYDWSWKVFSGASSHQVCSLWISVHQFMSTLHSLNSKTNYLVGDERVTVSDCVPPLRKVDTYYLGYSDFYTGFEIITFFLRFRHYSMCWYRILFTSGLVRVHMFLLVECTQNCVKRLKRHWNTFVSS